MSRRMNWNKIRHDALRRRDASTSRNYDRTTLEARAARETRRWLRTLHPRQRQFFSEDIISR